MSEADRIASGPASAPRDVGEARRVVEARRGRVADTLQELEERLVEEKEAIQDKLDVARPAREYVRGKPLVAVGVAAGAGLLLGLLTARSKRRTGEEPDFGDEDRDAIRRWRSERRKRLLESAEEELPSFEPPPSRVGRLFRDMAHELVGAGTALLIAQLVDRVQEEEAEGGL